MLRAGFDYGANIKNLPTTDLYKEEMKVCGWWFAQCSRCKWLLVIAPGMHPKCKHCGNKI